MAGNAQRIEAIFEQIEDRLAQARAAFREEFPATKPGPPVGDVIEVAPGDGALQSAVDAAKPGQTLLLTPEGFYGRCILRLKDSDGLITIRPKVDLPVTWGELRRAPLPILGTITTDPRAHDYTLRGIRIIQQPGGDLASVNAGTSEETTMEERAARITLVQSHLWAKDGGHRGFAMNAPDCTAVDTVIEGYWQSGRDSQAAGGWQHAERHRLERCYLEASGENVMFGGAKVSIPGGEGPSAIVIRRSYLRKLPEWRQHRGASKNLLEIKNARDVLIELSLLENSWIDAQSGHGLLFTLRATSPTASIEDVLLRANLLRNIEGASVSLLGHDDAAPNHPFKAARMRMLHNLFVDVREGVYVNRGWDDLVIDHNTWTGIKGKWLGMTGRWKDGGFVDEDKITGLTLTNNIAPLGAYGFHSDGHAPGLSSIDAMTLGGYQIAGNLLQSNGSIPVPAGNHLIPESSELVSALYECLHKAMLGIDGTTPGVPDTTRLELLAMEAEMKAWNAA